MNGYNVALVSHVLVAVLGVGQLGAVARTAAAVRRGGVPPLSAATGLGGILRSIRWCLVAMVVTGVWMDYAVGGAYHELWWLRASAILTVVMFLLHRRALGALSRVLRGDGDAGDAFRLVERAAWSMCGAVALITVLMEAKPF